MDKSTLIVGIDISKNSFEVYDNQLGHRQFDNTSSGFKCFQSELPEDVWIVMEATGSYHYQLACYLYQEGVNVSVLNPLVIKRYIQMKLRKVKTDKSDAKMIAQYGVEQPLERWQPPADYIDQSNELQTVLHQYFKQSTSIKNKIHSIEQRGRKQSASLKSLRRMLKKLQGEIKKLEEELETLVKQAESDLYSRVKSIPGIGKKTAIMLIVCSDGFRKFETAKQMVSYLGLAPMERSSGSSVRGVSRISKSGQPLIRNHLFMCSFTACSCNAGCKNLYDRLVAKGKSKKLALIAVTNKLVHQAFGIARNGLCYDPEFRSKKN